MTDVLSSFAVHVVMFCDVRVNTRYQTVKVEVRINMLEMSDCSEHKAMLMCCLSVDIRMTICQGFTPRNVSHVFGIYEGGAYEALPALQRDQATMVVDGVLSMRTSLPSRPKRGDHRQEFAKSHLGLIRMF